MGYGDLTLYQKIVVTVLMIGCFSAGTVSLIFPAESINFFMDIENPSIDGLLQTRMFGVFVFVTFLGTLLGALGVTKASACGFFRKLAIVRGTIAAGYFYVYYATGHYAAFKGALFPHLLFTVLLAIGAYCPKKCCKKNCECECDAEKAHED